MVPQKLNTIWIWITDLFGIQIVGIWSSNGSHFRSPFEYQTGTLHLNMGQLTISFGIQMVIWITDYLSAIQMPFEYKTLVVFIGLFIFYFLRFRTVEYVTIGQSFQLMMS